MAGEPHHPTQSLMPLSPAAPPPPPPRRILYVPAQHFNVMGTARFEIFKDKRDEWRWRLVAPNNEIICQSEGYTTRQSAKKGIAAVREHAMSATVVDETA